MVFRESEIRSFGARCWASEVEMTSREQNFVTFYSPGTLFAESTVRPVETFSSAALREVDGD